MKREKIQQSDVERALEEVRRVYANLAGRPIDRGCMRVKECCHFKLTGRRPYLTRGEALLAARALRATGRRRLPVNPTGACPLLEFTTGNCMIYDSRPFGCRTHFARQLAVRTRGPKCSI
ncbi:MAG TPA: YkgJ family cysteine cluster protein [Chthoniobacterales bacterium]|jgi:Fe-S-cluster containining protein